jgi:hypothetical protein
MLSNVRICRLTGPAPQPLPQVHPVVARLCTPIEGTDAGRLADCLGLDPSRFAGASAGGGGGGEDAREDALVSGAAFFDDPARFKVAPSPLNPQY